jgi:hypothetical protein
MTTIAQDVFVPIPHPPSKRRTTSQTRRATLCENVSGHLGKLNVHDIRFRVALVSALTARAFRNRFHVFMRDLTCILTVLRGALAATTFASRMLLGDVGELAHLPPVSDPSGSRLPLHLRRSQRPQAIDFALLQAFQRLFSVPFSCCI